MNKIKELEIAVSVFEKQLKERRKKDIITGVIMLILACLFYIYIITI